ncbi:AbiJ-NTD4 domain-containing protein [Pediococcus acidilactici]|uniref:AbiJ-NTD4 domain-containing protein n=1 Tax=Pediococcus acidilactici TaxID=1254 RepID=UPI003B42E853
MKFSERMGFVTIDNIIQKDSMDENLSNDIYNFIITDLEQHYNSPFSSPRLFYEDIWINFLHNRVDTPHLRFFQRVYDEMPFFEKYDFLEEYVELTDDITKLNHILKNNHSAYRMTNNYQIVPIVNDIDMMNINKSLNLGIDEGHLSKAVSELSKKQPNYITIIKESTDALEISIKNITNKYFNGNEKQPFGESIKILKENNFIPDHPAYLTALSKIYGYSSDGGIRHPKSGTNVDESSAIFFLEIASAFVSLLNDKSSNL